MLLSTFSSDHCATGFRLQLVKEWPTTMQFRQEAGKFSNSTEIRNLWPCRSIISESIKCFERSISIKILSHWLNFPSSMFWSVYRGTSITQAYSLNTCALILIRKLIVTGLILLSKQLCGLNTISMLSQPNSHELSQDKERRLSKVFGNKRTCIM